MGIKVEVKAPVISISNTRSGIRNDAKKISKSVISSNLVKCAMFGNDPNWGRIMSAIGNSGAYFKERKVDIILQNRLIVKNGVEVSNFDAKKISRLLKHDKINVIIDLHLGSEEATAYGCDMSYDYIEINAEYHT